MQPRRRRAVLGVLVALAAAALGPPAPASAVATTAACPAYELVGLRGQTEPAVVVYGDGGFNGSSAPLAAGTYAPGVSGRLPRPVSALSAWNSRMRDVCNADDVICQSTGTSAAAHQDYVKYADATAAFVNGVLTTLG